jgi:hypothetical protein
VKKKSIHAVCEHFELFHKAAMGPWIIIEIGSNHFFTQNSNNVLHVTGDGSQILAKGIEDVSPSGNLNP